MAEPDRTTPSIDDAVGTQEPTATTESPSILEHMAGPFLFLAAFLVLENAVTWGVHSKILEDTERGRGVTAARDRAYRTLDKQPFPGYDFIWGRGEKIAATRYIRATED